ncbi:MAG: hypothetical protein ITD33_03060 [Nitrosarchaeum sp.]|nr:hypothetical protein [Nitrosarchaeum sp.]
MKQPITKWVPDYTGKDHDGYVRLALHVIWGAIADLGRKGKECKQADAREFLLVRINEESNVWGELARSIGAKPLTEQNLGALVRRQRLTKAPPEARRKVRVFHTKEAVYGEDHYSRSIERYRREFDSR